MISIIGAGPAGCYAGYLLAKKGKQPTIYEEHQHLGQPVQCTGVVTSEIDNLVNLDSSTILNRISTAKVVSPDLSSAEMKLRNREYVIDRREFDKFLADRAMDAGAQIHTGHRFEGLQKHSIIIRDKKAGKRKTVKTKVVVGADGADSTVAQAAGLGNGKNHLIGMQARVKMETNPEVYEVHLGAPSCLFGWVVPESERTARIGLWTQSRGAEYLKEFLKQRVGPSWKSSIIEYQGGRIPIYTPKRIIANSYVYLIGDAAGHIKNTTAGGIIPGMMAGKALCNSLSDHKDYQQECKRTVGRKLNKHHLLRRMLDRFTEEDYNRLVRWCQQKRIKRIIQKESREFPSKMMLKLLLAEPRLLKFARFLYKTG